MTVDYFISISNNINMMCFLLVQHVLMIQENQPLKRFVAYIYIYIYNTRNIFRENTSIDIDAIKKYA